MFISVKPLTKSVNQSVEVIVTAWSVCVSALYVCVSVSNLMADPLELFPSRESIFTA